MARNYVKLSYENNTENNSESSMNPDRNEISEEQFKFENQAKLQSFKCLDPSNDVAVIFNDQITVCNCL